MVSKVQRCRLNYDISLNAEHGFCLLSILITGFIYGALAGVISTLLMVRGHIIGHARSNM